jgi:hypothetical protein
MMTERSGKPTKPPPHFSREGVFAGPFGESLETIRASQPRFRWAFPAKLNYCRQAHSCHQCGKRPMKLEWLYYRSPKWTWAALCGRLLSMYWFLYDKLPEAASKHYLDAPDRIGCSCDEPIGFGAAVGPNRV